jgi:hypothetical protein
MYWGYASISSFEVPKANAITPKNIRTTPVVLITFAAGAIIYAIGLQF